MLGNGNEIEKRLWEAADNLRANSKLRPAEYYLPVLGLIFLRYVDYKFHKIQEEIEAERSERGHGGRQVPIQKGDYIARGALYVPEDARYAYLLSLPESANLSRAVIDAMKAVERENDMLDDVLPKTYNRLDDGTLISLLRTLQGIDLDVDGDIFGRIYEYFLGQFAMSEGRRGGEFFTPYSIVRLIVEIMEPYHGKVLDPACGSGGMFVQSASFVERYHREPEEELSLYGQERISQTVRICQMNLAVHGLEGDIRQANTFYEDLHNSPGQFDYVMANPPFNVSGVDKERLADDPRFPFGLPSTDNANYLWIQIFYSALNASGRAGFVMANSAPDARSSEGEIRRRLIESGAVDVMVSVGSNFFYTVTLPCTLWFLDRGKADTERADKVLFIDARRTYEQVDRAHRTFTPAQIEFLANIARLYRGEEPEEMEDSAELMAEHFPDGLYRDVPGLCKVATIEEVAEQNWSLNPGRYVGVPERDDEEDEEFRVALMELHERLEALNLEARQLEEQVSASLADIEGMTYGE